VRNDLKIKYSALEKMVEFNVDGIMVVDHDGFIVFLNTAAAHMFGSSKSELLGQLFGHPLTPGESAEIELLPANGEVVVAELRTQKLEWEGKTAFLISIRDFTERKQIEEKLKEMSIYDSLTGLYNRNFFEEEMKRLSDGRHHPLGIIVADLDGLKFINDTLGHQAGDQMLIHTAQMLRESFRSSDIIARIGGDEFALLLTNTEHAVVEQILHRLRQAIQDYNNSDPQLPLSLSLGHAVSEGEAADMHALFREADNRMYRDKIQHKKSPWSAIP